MWKGVMRGRIVKGIAGFYYVCCGDRIYECKAKGVFRKDNRKPLVGDWVEMDVLDQAEGLGNISALLPRASQLIRPAVANVDQALVIFAGPVPGDDGTAGHPQHRLLQQAGHR